MAICQYLFVPIRQLIKMNESPYKTPESSPSYDRPVVGLRVLLLVNAALYGLYLFLMFGVFAQDSIMELSVFSWIEIILIWSLVLVCGNAKRLA